MDKQYEIHFKTTYTIEVEAANEALAHQIAYKRLNDVACDITAGDFTIEETVEIN